MDFEISPEADTIRISEWCQVQTQDHPGANLFAVMQDSVCFSQGLDDFSVSGEFDNNFYATESATGLATLHCNFDQPFSICVPHLQPSIAPKPEFDSLVDGFLPRPDCP